MKLRPDCCADCPFKDGVLPEAIEVIEAPDVMLCHESACLGGADDFDLVCEGYVRFGVNWFGGLTEAD